LPQRGTSHAGTRRHGRLGISALCGRMPDSAPKVDRARTWSSTTTIAFATPSLPASTRQLCIAVHVRLAEAVENGARRTDMLARYWLLPRNPNEPSVCLGSAMRRAQKLAFDRAGPVVRDGRQTARPKTRRRPSSCAPWANARQVMGGAILAGRRLRAGRRLQRYRAKRGQATPPGAEQLLTRWG